MARGDTIRCDRRVFGSGLVYHHHGIDLGDGTVAHARPERFSRLLAGGRIVRTSLEAFAAGSPISLVSHADAPGLPPLLPAEEIGRRAESLVGRVGYCPVFANCEHFTTWCATGRPFSRQVELLSGRLLATAARLATSGSFQVAAGTAERWAGRAILAGTFRAGLRMLIPASLAAEGAAVAAEWVAHQSGRSRMESRRAGEAAGVATSAMLFAAAAATAGPVAIVGGAVAGIAFWSGGTIASSAAGGLARHLERQASPLRSRSVRSSRPSRGSSSPSPS